MGRTIGSTSQVQEKDEGQVLEEDKVKVQEEDKE